MQSGSKRVQLKKGEGAEEKMDESKPLYQSTVLLAQLYRKCSSDFKYTKSMNPRRGLTKDCVGVKNNGLDNASHDLILYVNDVLRDVRTDLRTDRVFRVEDKVGQGSFGQVVRCEMLEGEVSLGRVAVKVVKNKPAYYNQALVERRVLRLLNREAEEEDSAERKRKSRIVALLDSFEFNNHLCLVFPLLSMNLYELIKQNKFRGLPLDFIQSCVAQVNEALSMLAELNVVHCDVKPENILLEDLNSVNVKLIDFGSSCFKGQAVYTYIQSRFYRAPEVIVGLPYDNAIDMWSLGCLAVELFVGLPVFPGVSEHNQLARIVETVGPLPLEMLQNARDTPKFFKPVSSPSSMNQTVSWELMSAQEWAQSQNLNKEEPMKRYIKDIKLDDIIMNGTGRSLEADELLASKRNCSRSSLLDLVRGLLQIEPSLRWTAEQASGHPFLRGESFHEPFYPIIPHHQPLRGTNPSSYDSVGSLQPVTSHPAYNLTWAPTSSWTNVQGRWPSTAPRYFPTEDHHAHGAPIGNASYPIPFQQQTQQVPVTSNTQRWPGLTINVNVGPYAGQAAGSAWVAPGSATTKQSPISPPQRPNPPYPLAHQVSWESGSLPVDFPVFPPHPTFPQASSVRFFPPPWSSSNMTQYASCPPYVGVMNPYFCNLGAGSVAYLPCGRGGSFLAPLAVLGSGANVQPHTNLQSLQQHQPRHEKTIQQSQQHVANNKNNRAGFVEEEDAALFSFSPDHLQPRSNG